MAANTSHSDRRSRDSGQRLDALESQFKEDPSKHAPALAEAYIKDGRPRRAIEILEKHANGKDVNRQVLLAQAWFDSFENDKSAALLKQAAKLGNLKDNLRAQVLLGELAFEEGNPEKAKKFLGTARTLDPQNKRAAQLLHSLGEAIDLPAALDEDELTVGFRTVSDQAQSASSAVTQIMVGVVLCGALLGGYYWWTQRVHEAKKLAVAGAELAESADINSLRQAEGKFLKARESHSGNEHAIAGLADVYALLWVDHGIEEAKASALEYVDLAKDEGIEKAERFSAEVLVVFGEGRYPEAEQIAAAVIEKGGVSEKLYWTLGLTQRALNKNKLGRDNLRRAYDLKGDAPHFATSLGDAYEADDDLRNANFFWKLAADRNSNYVPGVARSVISRSRKGEDAKLLLEDLKRLDETPEDQLGTRDRAAIELARSTVMNRLGKSKAALAAANQAINFGGETSRSLSVRGAAFLAEGKMKAGFRDLEASKSLSPKSVRYLYGLVDSYLEYGKFDKAIKLLKLAAPDLAQDPGYYTTLADAFRDKGVYDKAIENYDKALKAHDGYADALLGRGITDWKKKKYDDATSWLEKAAGARSKFPEVYEAIGLMWTERGFTKEAHTQLEMAEKLFVARGTDSRRMKKFYISVIKTYGKARGGSSYVKRWAQREEAYRKSQQE